MGDGPGGGKSAVCNSHCQTSFALILTIAAQVGVALFVLHATKIMDQEWPHVLKTHGERVMVVEMEQFWGPVHVLVPTNCREATKWDNVLAEDQAEAAAPDVKTAVRILPGHTTNSHKSTKPTPEPYVPPTIAPNKVEAQEEQLEAEIVAAKSQAKKEKKLKKELHSLEALGEAVSMNGEEDGASQDLHVTTKRKLKEEASHEDSKEKSAGQLQLRKSSIPPPAEERELLIIPKIIPNVSICINGSHQLRTFKGPSYWHRYFSMISMSSIITGGTTNMAKLHQSRLRTYKSMFAGLMVTMFMKYSLKLIDVMSGCFGHKYVQLWNGGRTTLDKMMESLMIHGVSIVFTLAMQLTLCTLFLTFWEGEYFVMSYIPGIGFVVFFGSFVCFTIGMVVDRVKQTMLHSSNTYIYCFWFWWVFWMFMVCVPMLGYCVYVLQFVAQVVEGHWLHTQPFSEEFIHASRIVCHAAGWFTGIAVLELCIILKLDLDEGKTRTAF